MDVQSELFKLLVEKQSLESRREEIDDRLAQLERQTLRLMAVIEGYQARVDEESEKSEG